MLIELVHKFCKHLVETCVSKGMIFHPDPLVPISSHLAFAHQIKNVLQKIDQNLQLLIVVLPNVPGTGAYETIKRICETGLGIVSQCFRRIFNFDNLRQENFESAALKINVKLGGRNHALLNSLPQIEGSNEVTLLGHDKATMFLGADVTHPDSTHSMSIAAVVASMDWPKTTHYKKLVSMQPMGKEIIVDLERMTGELLKTFKSSNQYYPSRIIFYRDGVGESQFSQVLSDEVQAIRKACSELLVAGEQPKITYVVVQKRHHTRFFPIDSKESDDSAHIIAGTVVDTKICHPIEYDLYLCSYAGGTSRPVHYYVLFDENKLTVNELQTLTNDLCYTFPRCTRAILIGFPFISLNFYLFPVPPVYYAHLAAYRARIYCTSTGGERGQILRVKENLEEFMYYL